MTRRQVDDILARESPQGQERIRKILEHSCSMYDFSGKHIPHEFEKENLLDAIGKRDTYVVDSNTNWKKECKENLEKAFIISPTLSRENPNTKDLILEAARCKLGNIFSVGIDANLNCILVDRIDEPFHYAFDKAKLTEASKGKGPTVAKQKAEMPTKIEKEKELIRDHIRLAFLFSGPLDSTISLAFIDSGKASDLPSPDKIQKTIEVLKGDIRRRLPACKHDIGKSKRAVEVCYATLLIEDTEPTGIRIQFDKPNYANVFGDMYILQTAIYLGANIMTKDRKLAQMASYAGIKCFHVPSPIKQTCSNI